jgi:hypothetical protein
MSLTDTQLTVIIPTTAESKRSTGLFRAIQSILEQNALKIDILLVINGHLFDKSLFDSLQKRNDLKITYLEEGNLPKAIYFGVSKVTTLFYCFLDDDDCFLPNTMQQRLQPLLNDRSVDYTVSNGFNYINNIDSQRTKNFPNHCDNAASLILRENWLASCGGIYRKATISQNCFENMPKYLEWTYLGFLLATTKKGIFLVTPAFRTYDTPASLSKSKGYSLGILKSFEQIIAISPDSLKRETEIKYGKILHDLSSYCLENNQIIDAIKLHILSLSKPSGYKYLAYSRYILSHIVQRPLKRAT